MRTYIIIVGIGTFVPLSIVLLKDVLFDEKDLKIRCVLLFLFLLCTQVRLRLECLRFRLSTSLWMK